MLANYGGEPIYLASAVVLVSVRVLLGRSAQKFQSGHGVFADKMIMFSLQHIITLG